PHGLRSPLFPYTTRFRSGGLHRFLVAWSAGSKRGVGRQADTACSRGTNTNDAISATILRNRKDFPCLSRNLRYIHSRKLAEPHGDRQSTRLNSRRVKSSY